MRIISILAAASLVTRIPLRSSYLYSWDSANFALGLERFSVFEHQPHPPGYILYIAAGRLFNFFLDNPNGSLVLLSIIGSVGAVVGIYLVTSSIFDRTTGLIASILLLFSPLAWLHGEVALPYMVTLPLVIAATWLLYQLFFHRRYAVAAAIVIGIAAGFRQEVLLFLGPFWLLGSFRAGIRPMLMSWLAMAVAIAVWMAPLVYLVGGATKYRELNSVQFESGVLITSVFSAGAGNELDVFFKNTNEVWKATLWFAGFSSVMFIYLAGLILIPSRLVSDRRLLFLILLLLPPFSFYVFFHFGQYGYLLAYGAPLIILVSRALMTLAEDFNRAFPRRYPDTGVKNDTTGMSTKPKTPGYVFLIIFLSLSVLINTGLFFWATHINWIMPTVGVTDTVSSVYGKYSASGIRETDRQTEAALSAVKNFDPDTTIVGSISVYPSPHPYSPDWRQLMYYLPEYRVLNLTRPGDDSGDYTEEGFRQVLLIGTMEPGQSSAELAPVQEIPGYAPIAVTRIPPDGGILRTFRVIQKSDPR